MRVFASLPANCETLPAMMLSRLSKSVCFCRRSWLFLLGAWLLVPCAARAENWPCWRGPRGDGTSLEKNIPVRWSATENIRWKVPVPGTGHASPIVWEDRIFLVSCLEEKQQRILLCYDRPSGKLLWQRVVLTAPLERKHRLNSYASSTPATDGERVYVTFLDRQWMFVAAYDFQGRQLWAVRPGVFHSRHGYCSCPVLYRDLVIVNGDHDGDSYIVALDRRTGRTVWKVPREFKTRSYVTPIIRRLAGRTQMILSGSKCVTSYDPDTGRLLWIVHGPTEQFVASMVDNGHLVFLTAGYPERHILAIRPDGTGNVTKTHIVWRTRQGAAYVPSPVVVGEHLYVVSDQGVATCFEAETGRVRWRKRLGVRFSASPVVAEGRIYFQADDGTTTVVQAGPRFRRLAVNRLGEYTYASAAVSQGNIFIRSEKHLWCIGK